MSKISIRGYITGPEYDASWAAPYIEKGLWTPSSKVRRDLDAASKDEPLTVSVSSPGGSVFDGYEMANAINEWKRETGQAVSVEVGALAASMGSYLGFFLSPDVAIHRNTKAMFHGAASITWGGKEAHEDTAILLAQINDQIKGDLVSKGVAPETVDEWLSEGRMGWLDATQIMEYGMAQTILDADAPAEKPDAKIMEQAIGAANTAGAPAIAAALAEIETEPEDTQDERDEPGDDAGESETYAGDAPEQADGSEGPESEAEGRPEPAGEGEPESEPDPLEAIEARITELESERDALSAKLTESESAYRDLQADRDRIKENLKKAELSAETLSKRLARLVGTATAAPTSTTPDGLTWEAAVQEHGYVEARRRFPELHASYEKNRRTGAKAG